MPRHIGNASEVRRARHRSPRLLRAPARTAPAEAARRFVGGGNLDDLLEVGIGDGSGQTGRVWIYDEADWRGADLQVIPPARWVIAAVLLIALGIGLFYIASALEGIASSLDKVAYGVRAIETETSPLPACIDGINGSLAPVVGGFGVVGAELTSADKHLGNLAGILGVK